MRILRGHETEVYTAIFSPDGKWIATGDIDAIVRVWDVASGQELFQLEGRGTTTSMAFSPDGRRLVVGSWDSAARLWDLATRKVEQTFIGTVKGVQAVAFSPDGRQVATAGGDATVKVWNASTDRDPLKLQGNISNVLCVAFSADGKRIVTGSHDRTALVWEAATEGHVAAWDEEERAAAELRPTAERELAELLRLRAVERK